MNPVLGAVLILLPASVSAEQMLAHARALGATRVHIVAWVSPTLWDWAKVDRALAEAERRLVPLRGPGVTTNAIVLQELSELLQALEAGRFDAVMLARDTPTLSKLRLSARLLLGGHPVLFPASGAPGPVHHALFVIPSEMRRALGVARRLAPHFRHTPVSTVVTLGHMPVPKHWREEVGQWLDWQGEVRLEHAPALLTEGVGVEGVDLVVVALDVSDLLLQGATLLSLGDLLAPEGGAVLHWPPHARALSSATWDAPDVLVGVGQGRLEARSALGHPDAVGRARAALVEGAEVLSRVEVEAGAFEMPEGAGPLGLAPIDEAGAVGEVFPGALFNRLEVSLARVGLIDAESDPSVLEGLGEGRAWWAVRTDDSVPFGVLRARWAESGVRAVLDAGQVLSDGHPADLPAQVLPLRLIRVARRLRWAGVGVDLVLAAGSGAGFACVPPSQASPQRVSTAVAASWRPPGGASAIEALSDAPLTRAHNLEVLLDNRAARLQLLTAIEDARGSIHFQVFMYEEDDVSRVFTEALAEAGARGVAVRVMVDALGSFYGPMRLKRPLLVDLAGRPGVEVRAVRDFGGLPGVEDLKRRDHRKLVTIDASRAFVCGRNLGDPYYTGFDEVALDTDTPFRMVPWLDASVSLEGPVVAAIDDTMRQIWVEAGGAPWPQAPIDPRGVIDLRFIVHEGLRDAHTLEAWRCLIDEARRRLIVVNTFPLQFELQHALLRALERGVEVIYLVGNVRPLYGGRHPFPVGPEGSTSQALIADLMTQVIHGRLDPLVSSGARVLEFGVPEAPGWPEGFSPLLPHVHAKMVLADSERLGLGSANVDVTSAYWESEAIVLIESPPEVVRVERELEVFLRASVPLDRDPERWEALAARRAWLTRNWPSLMG